MLCRKDYFKILLNIVIAIFIVILCFLVIPKVLVYFMPFVIGWIISMIANPLVRWLENRMKVKRKASSAIVIIIVLAVIILLVYLIIARLSEEVVGFSESLPNVWASLEDDMKNIGRNYEIFYQKLPKDIQESFTNVATSVNNYFKDVVSSLSTPTVAAVSNFAKNIPLVIIGIIMCLLSAYFFISDREYVIEWVKKYTSKSIQGKWNIIYGSIKTAVGGYFKAQLKIEGWIYLLLVIGLSILGINYSLLIALGIACLDVLPFFGTGTVMVPWVIVKFLSGDYKMAIGLLIIWGVGQLVRQIIQPKIVGDSIGMPPIPTLFLLYLGYRFAGVIGMIIAVPVGIIIVNLNEAGLFDNIKRSIVMLVEGVNNFRRIDDKEEQIPDERGENKSSESQIEDGEASSKEEKK